MRETRGSEGGCCYVDGNRDYTATTLIFVNDALTDYRIWKPLVQELGDRYPEWRFVRYELLTWQEESPCCDRESCKTALLELSHDLASLLLSIRANGSRTHIIGLGLGASITLNLLAKDPGLATSLIGISFSIPRSLMSTAAIVAQWKERVTLAEKWGMRITSDKAVSRWLPADERGSKLWVTVKEIVESGTVEQRLTPAVLESFGLKQNVFTNEPFDPEKALTNLQVRSLFLAGSMDGVMPEEMSDYPMLMSAGNGHFGEVSRTSRIFW